MHHVLSGSLIVFSSASLEKTRIHLGQLQEKAKQQEATFTADELELTAKKGDLALVPFWGITSDEEMATFGDYYPKSSYWIDGDSPVESI